MALQKPVKIKNIDVLNDPIKVTEYCTTTHDYCTYITSLISDYVNNNNKNIPVILVERYIRLVCDQILCWSLNYDKHLKNLKYILENVNFNKQTIKYVNNNNELIIILISTMKDINFEFIKDISKNQEIFTSLVENFINTNQYINEIFDYAVIKKYDKTLTLLLDNKFKVDDGIFLKIITFNNSNNIIEIIKKCIANGLTITKNTVKIILDSKDKHNYSYNYYQQNFDKIIIFLYDNGSTNFTISELIKFFDHNELLLSNVVNHIIDNNYNISESEFLELCKKKIKVNNISKVKKYFDNKEIKNEIYYNHINYPIEFEYTIDMLRNECKFGNLTQVKTIIKTIKPDESCLEHACLYSGSNTSIIKLLHETYGIKFTDKCIINLIQQHKYNRVISYVKGRYLTKNPDIKIKDDYVHQNDFIKDNDYNDDDDNDDEEY